VTVFYAFDFFNVQKLKNKMLSNLSIKKLSLVTRICRISSNPETNWQERMEMPAAKPQKN